MNDSIVSFRKCHYSLDDIDGRLTYLSRPHNETREYWTTNGVTQYAQGNNMNTDKLIPISYVKKFTPLAVGDVVYGHNYGDTSSEYTLDVDGVKSTNESIEYDNYFVVSFADRPNTGKQPVGDDVAVDVYYKNEWHTDSAQSYIWSYDGNPADITKWKPNHSAMLKQYQAEQALNNSKVQNMHTVNETPTFTQAQADADELPTIGSEYQTSTGKFKAMCYGYNQNHKQVCVGKDSEGYLQYHLRDMIKPIQTDEEKLRSAIYAQAATPQIGDAELIPLIDALLASNKFTITLNK
jgi:hypothetical protein